LVRTMCLPGCPNSVLEHHFHANFRIHLAPTFLTTIYKKVYIPEDLLTYNRNWDLMASKSLGTCVARGEATFPWTKSVQLSGLFDLYF